MIYWYHYYSFWIFIWFLLYKIKVIKYQPSFNYILACSFLVYKTIVFCFLLIANGFKQNSSPDLFKIYISKFIIALIVDWIPILFMLPFKLDITTFYINLLVFIMYLIFMKLSLNYNIFDISNMYISRTTRLTNYSFKDWSRELSNFFLL